MILDHLFGDFALAIVVLTLIIKLILFPLTLQQLKSMKAMQVLQPQMQEIRKKYANDQQAQMQAMQAMYKEYGINPAGGCLPLLIQLPVLYGLYAAFRLIVSANTKNPGEALLTINRYIYPFVPKFSAFPDVTFRWFEWLNFLNPILHLTWTWTFPLNIADPTPVLPILAGLATFVQLRMSQAATKRNNAGAKSGAPDPSQQTMAMMQYVMPFVTAFIGFTVPAGLALYWTVSSLFQVVQQYFVTGWGGLAPAASVAVAGSKSVTTKITPPPVSTRVVDADNKVVSKSNGSNGSNGRTTTTPLSTTAKLNGGDAVKLSTSSTAAGGSSNGGSSYSRGKGRSGSASARRRGGSRSRR